MELFARFESIHFRIGSQEEILHKGIFVAFFGIGSEKTLNLADCQFADGGSVLTFSPYYQDIGKSMVLHDLVKATAGI